jgi:hypothetical protein
MLDLPRPDVPRLSAASPSNQGMNMWKTLIATILSLGCASVASAGPPWHPKPVTRPTTNPDFTRQEELTHIGMTEQQLLNIWPVEPVQKDDQFSLFILPNGVAAAVKKGRVWLLAMPPAVGTTEENLKRFNAVDEDRGAIRYSYEIKSEDQNNRTYVRTGGPGPLPENARVIVSKLTGKVVRIEIDD